MAFSRTQMVAAVAGTLSLAVLTGCPATPPTGPGTPAPGASTSAVPSAGAPSTAPSGSAGPSTTPSGSTAPSTGPSGSADPSTAPSATTSAPPPSGKTVIVSGKVYDEEGATVDGALVTVKSLNTSVPYEATATTTQGSWVVNNVPEGANVEIIVTKDGWTSRRRTDSFQGEAQEQNVVDFGAAGGNANNNSKDPEGESYFISDYPEIASTEPVTDATGVDNQKLTFKLKLSETLDEDARDVLVNSLTILPANEEAKGSGLTGDAIDIETAEDSNAADGVAAIDLDDADFDGYGYTIEEGSTFLGNSDRDVSATWNADGTELTFSFDATLIADDSDEAKYQAVLVSQGDEADDLIEDEDGNQLGTNHDGDLSGYPDEGMIIANVFKEVDLSAVDDTDGYNNRGESNWGSTHDTAVNWEIKRDDTDPKLTRVNVAENVDGDFRIELEFSEGMAAYNGTSIGDYDKAGFEDLRANFRFALGEDVGDTEDVDLGDDDTPTVISTIAMGDKLGDVNGELENELTFDNGLVQEHVAAEDGDEDDDVSNVDDADLAGGEIFVEVDDNNPTKVFIWIKDRPNYFDNKVSEIKAYIEGVEDPAGNAISENDAEDSQVRASI